MWSWKHGCLLACTLVTTRLHNIDIKVFTFTFTHHTCMNREHKTGSMNWLLHLYFTHVIASSTISIPAGLSWWPRQTKISWRVTDRQHSDDGYVLLIRCFCFFIYRSEMNCCHHSWEWSLCIWENLAHQKDRLKYGGLPVWSLSVFGSWFWDTPRRCLRRFLIAVSNGSKHFGVPICGTQFEVRNVLLILYHFQCLHSRTPFAITVTRCEYPLMQIFSWILKIQLLTPRMYVSKKHVILYVCSHQHVRF